MTRKSYRFHYENFKVPSGNRQLMLTKCSPFTPAGVWQLEVIQGPRATTPSDCERVGVMAVLDRGLCSSEAWNTDSYLSMSGTNPKDHYNHVRLKCFLIALLVIN